MSQSKGSGNGSGTSHVETIIQGDKGVDFTSGGDTTLKGAQIIGDQVTGAVGGDLAIISEQDTYNESRKQSSSGGSASVGWTIGAGGPSVGGSYNSQNQKGKSDYASVDEQSGIFAGEGGFDITVGGNTHLEGAVIASEADPEKNTLATGSITTKDIKNNSSYEVTTRGIGGEFSYEKGGDSHDKTANKGSISPSQPMKESSDDSSATQSAISKGNIIITNEERQKEITGLGSEDTIDRLNRDVENANPDSLSKPPGLDEIFKQQSETSDAFGLTMQAAATTIGDIAEARYKATGDPRWGENGAYTNALRAAATYMLSEYGVGNGLNSTLGLVVNQMTTKMFQELARDIATGATDDPDGRKLIENLITNMAATGSGLIIGGEGTAQVVSMIDRYNRALHTDQAIRLKELYAKFKDDPEMRAALQAAVAYLTNAGSDLDPSDPYYEEVLALERKGKELWEKGHVAFFHLNWDGTFDEKWHDIGETFLSQNDKYVEVAAGGAKIGRGIVGYAAAGGGLMLAPATGPAAAGTAGLAVLEILDSTFMTAEGIIQLTRKYESSLGKDIYNGIINADAGESLKWRYAKDVLEYFAGRYKGKIYDRLSPHVALAIEIALRGASKKIDEALGVADN